jgi:hypothetical protein
MSLAHEYRGYVVLVDGRPKFERMDPRVKELFVIDQDDIFDTEPWKKVTGGSVAYRLGDSMAAPGKDAYAARDVDTNADGNHKYALQLRVVKGDAPGECPSASGQVLMGCGHNVDRERRSGLRLRGLLLRRAVRLRRASEPEGRVTRRPRPPRPATASSGP